jgi:hypothetical protein
MMDQSPPQTETAKASRPKPAGPLAIALAAGFLIFIIVVGINGTDDPKPSASATATTEPAETVPTRADRPTMGIPLAQYVTRFAAMNEGLGTPYRLHPLVKRSANGLGIFTSVLSDNVGLVGTVDSNDQLISVMVIMSGDGSRETTANILGATTAAMAAAVADTRLQDDEPIMATMMNDAIDKHAAGAKKFEITRILNGVRLTMSVAPDTNTTFTIEPATQPKGTLPADS